jgi:hypothetical protein
MIHRDDKATNHVRNGHRWPTNPTNPTNPTKRALGAADAIFDRHLHRRSVECG